MTCSMNGSQNMVARLQLSNRSCVTITASSIILRPPPPSFPGVSDGKESSRNVGDLGSIPGSGRPPGEGKGYPLLYSCLDKSMDRRTWNATVHQNTTGQT